MMACNTGASCVVLYSNKVIRFRSSQYAVCTMFAQGFAQLPSSRGLSKQLRLVHAIVDKENGLIQTVLTTRSLKTVRAAAQLRVVRNTLASVEAKSRATMTYNDRYTTTDRHITINIEFLCLCCR